MTLPAIAVRSALIALTLLFCAVPARAEDVKVFSSVAMRAVIEEISQRFERDTRHRVVPTFGLAAALKSRIEGGEAFDLAILLSEILPVKGAALGGVFPGDVQTYVVMAGAASNAAPQAARDFLALCRRGRWLRRTGRVQPASLDLVARTRPECRCVRIAEEPGACGYPPRRRRVRQGDVTRRSSQCRRPRRRRD